MPFYVQCARLYVDTQRMAYRLPHLPVRRTEFHLRLMNETCMPRDQTRFEQGGDERTIFVSISGEPRGPREELPAYTRSDRPPYDRALQRRGYLCRLRRVDLARSFSGLHMHSWCLIAVKRSSTRVQHWVCPRSE